MTRVLTYRFPWHMKLEASHLASRLPLTILHSCTHTTIKNVLVNSSDGRYWTLLIHKLKSISPKPHKLALYMPLERSRNERGIQCTFLSAFEWRADITETHPLSKKDQCETGAKNYVIPYNNKFWRRTKFGKLVNRHEIAKFKFRQYYFIPHYLWHTVCILPN